jgi:hypothetical protein
MAVSSRGQARHRHIEWLKFSQTNRYQRSADTQIHVVLDNYATHKHPSVLKWLAKRLRFSHAPHRNQRFMDEYGGAFLQKYQRIGSNVACCSKC